MEKRFWEIDFLRGVAILMMVTFHFLFDLDYFGIREMGAGWRYFALATASIFILLVGVSLTLSYSRSKGSFPKYLKRGVTVFSWGLLITGMTYIFLEGFVLFGILHLIGLSIILAYPFLRFKLWSAFAGAGIIALGIYLKNFTFDTSWLLWLGFRPETFYTVDYFPVLPWFGLVLIGLFVGNWLYPGYTRKFELKELGKLVGIKQICWLGRKSLLIYLIHQPILIGILYLMGYSSFFFF